MFGISLAVIGTHLAAALGGGAVGAWFHSAYLKVKADFQSEEATLKARVSALEAAFKVQVPVAPAVVTSTTTPPTAP